MAQAQQDSQPPLKEKPRPSTTIDFTKDVEVGWFSNPQLTNTGGTSTYMVGGHTGGNTGLMGNGRIKRIFRMPNGGHRMLIETSVARGEDHWIVVEPNGGVSDVMDEGWREPV